MSSKLNIQNNFFLVFCKNRKKFDKFAKINKLKNKTVIDINKILINFNINKNNEDSLKYFKVLLFKKFQSAQEKKRDLYYIPDFTNQDINIESLINIKKLTGDYTFNLLYFNNEFSDNDLSYTSKINDLLVEFDAAQLIEDY